MATLLETTGKVIRIEAEPEEVAMARHINLVDSLTNERQFYENRYRTSSQPAVEDWERSDQIYYHLHDLTIDRNIPQQRNLILFNRSVIPLPPKRI